MDVVNFDTLVAQGRIASASQINLDEDLFLFGSYDPRRRDFKATTYPIYAIRARDVLAPPINNKDRKIANASISTSTNSAVYVDLSSMSLLTSELDPIAMNASGNYQIHFSCNYSLSDTLSSAQFILSINGIDIGATQTTETPAAGVYRTNLIWQVPGLVAGSSIKIKFRVVPGNPGSMVNVFNRTLMIDGVNSQSII